MGFFDNIGGALRDVVGQVVAAEAPALVSAVLAKTNLGDLQGLVAKLQQAAARKPSRKRGRRRPSP